MPTPRRNGDARRITEKYAALLVPLLVVNLVTFLTIAVSVQVIDEPLDLVNLTAVHAVSVLYLLCCGAVGLLLSVLVEGGRTAKRASVGAILALWLFESLLTGSNYEWLGALTPMRYFDPPAILVEGTVDPLSIGVLVLATLVLFALSHRLFVRSDVG